ncbi:MAG: FAD-dependent oxidoreductase [Planctomycetes bacterium]|nr:FAD-dependent oxidoreductase [Planctomycetota bacterium]
MTRAGGARAFVLGGGVAGLGAAFGLADRGFEVTLLESRGWLGGRAFAFTDRNSGRRLDNGPHVMLGCYRATRALLARLGTDGLFRADRRLAMSYRREGGGLLRLALPALPVPLAMPIGLCRLGLPLGATLRALYGTASSLLGARAGASVADWLAARRQLGEPADVLWQPLCRAIMNVEPGEAAARDFLATLREAFAGRAASAAFWLPKATWSEIFGDPAPAALARVGAAVRTGARVAAFEPGGDRIAAIELAHGERIAVGERDLVVSAMPWTALGRLVPGLPASSLRGAPIVTAHVALAEDVPVLPDDGAVTALVRGAPFHFVLRTPGALPRHFALLAGGNRDFDGMKVDAIEAAARDQLARYYPGFDRKTDATVRISKENAATFVAAPGSRALRPQPGRLPGGPTNLLVCGDWTDTGLPATLEGAARSAETMLRSVPT